MGEVYRARDTRLGRQVAIKVLPAERMADDGRRRRFVQEARAASALNHPNIVTIHEIESADGVDFIVMEYVAGRTLDALIPARGMRLPDALRTAIPIADALACAHARGIVHRDVKPANVTPGMIAGTAGYLSPEQAKGGTVDARSDVFSFGAVLYEMVTGRRAFAGSSTAETLAAVVRDEPKAASEVVSGVPHDLDRLIQRCLRKDVDRRVQHMLDVKLELEQVREDSDLGRPVVRVRRRRRPWIVAAAAAGSTRHLDARGRARAGALPGRRAGRVLLVRREAGQPRHLPQARRLLRGPARHHGPGARRDPELVAGRPADRVRPGLLAGPDRNDRELPVAAVDRYLHSVLKESCRDVTTPLALTVMWNVSRTIRLFPRPWPISRRLLIEVTV
jgi:hypothetical protein